MTQDNPHHFALAVPAERRTTANLVGLIMGLGPDNFSVPLVTPPDMEMVTHYGSCFPGSEGFRQMLLGAKAGILPPGIPWEDFGTTAEAVIAAFADMVIDLAPDAPGQAKPHFEAMLATSGLIVQAVNDQFD